MKSFLALAMVGLFGCEADTPYSIAVHPLAEDNVGATPLGAGGATHRFPAADIPPEIIIQEKRVMPLESNQPVYPSFEF